MPPLFSLRAAALGLLQASPVQLRGATCEMTGLAIGVPIAVLARTTFVARALAVNRWEEDAAAATSAGETVAVYVMVIPRLLATDVTLQPGLKAPAALL
jgi:hypothetical protein